MVGQHISCLCAFQRLKSCTSCLVIGATTWLPCYGSCACSFLLRQLCNTHVLCLLWAFHLLFLLRAFTNQLKHCCPAACPACLLHAVQAPARSNGLVRRVTDVRAAVAPGCRVVAVRHAAAVPSDGDHAAVASSRATGLDLNPKCDDFGRLTRQQHQGFGELPCCS